MLKNRFALSLLLISAAWAQPMTQGTVQPSSGMRAMMYAPGAEVFEIKVMDGAGQPVNDLVSRVFRAGERIRFQVNASFPGYFYAVNVSPQGQRTLLSPANTESNQVGPGAPLTYPQQGYITFDSVPGVEEVQFYVSKVPIQNYESLRNVEPRILAPQAATATPTALLPSNQPPAQIANAGQPSGGVGTAGQMRGVQVAGASGMRAMKYEMTGAGIVGASQQPTNQPDGVIGISLRFNHQ